MFVFWLLGKCIKEIFRRFSWLSLPESGHAVVREHPEFLAGIQQMPLLLLDAVQKNCSDLEVTPVDCITCFIDQNVKAVATSLRDSLSVLPNLKEELLNPYATIGTELVEVLLINLRIPLEEFADVSPMVDLDLE
jgi:hypothetical protein